MESGGKIRRRRISSYCGVPQCKTYRSEGVFLYCIPKHVRNSPELLAKWSIALKMGKPFPKYFSICSKHFTEREILIPRREQNKFFKTRLTFNAFPTRKLPTLDIPCVKKSQSKRPAKNTTLTYNDNFNTDTDDPIERFKIRKEGSYCGVQRCRSNYNTIKDLSLHSIPEEVLCSSTAKKEWLVALKMENDFPKNFKVCSLHFSKDQLVRSENAIDTDKTVDLVEGAFPTENLPRTKIKIENDDLEQKVNNRYKKVLMSKEEFEELSSGKKDPFRVYSFETNEEPTGAMSVDFVDVNKVCKTSSVKINKIFSTVHTQTNDELKINTAMSFDMLTDKQIKMYTGLSKIVINELCTAVFEHCHTQPSKFNLNTFDTYMVIKDQFVLCLIKYRLNLLFSILGMMYGINEIVVKRIFVQMTKLLYFYFINNDFWSLRFKTPHSNKVILYNSEITVRSKTVNSNTKEIRKYLVGTDDKRNVIYCSDAYSGVISDQLIVDNSNLLKKLQPGDKIFADNSLSVILEQIRSALPKSSYRKNQESESKTYKPNNMNITNNLSENEKKFSFTTQNKLLSEILPSILLTYVNEIVYVGTMLCNYQKNN